MTNKVTLYPIFCESCSRLICYSDTDNNSGENLRMEFFCDYCYEVTIKEKSK